MREHIKAVKRKLARSWRIRKKQINVFRIFRGEALFKRRALVVFPLWSGGGHEYMRELRHS